MRVLLPTAPSFFARFGAFVRAAVAVTLIGLSPALSWGQTRVTDLNDRGWQALRDGDGDRAATLFAEALTIRPNDPVLLAGYGGAARAQGRPVDAMARLKRALELDPRLAVASRLLGQTAFDEGDVDLAIRTYESALKYAPGDPSLTKALDACRREVDVHHGFEDRRYDRFRVMFEGRAQESLAREATSIFHSAFFRIGHALGEYPTNTIVAVLYTEQQFRDITRAPEWSRGRYDGRIRIPVAGAQEKPELFERVLTHELVHAVVAGIAPRGVPTWLNEGLAQLLDGTDPQHARQRLKALGRSIPLKSLEGSFEQLTPAGARIAYDESLLAVGVIDRPGFLWTRLLHRLGDGQPFEGAIKNFGLSYADLEAPFAR
jgi:Flp pilus assembly protein TadD